MQVLRKNKLTQGMPSIADKKAPASWGDRRQAASRTIGEEREIVPRKAPRGAEGNSEGLRPAGGGSAGRTLGEENQAARRLATSTR